MKVLDNVSLEMKLDVRLATSERVYPIYIAQAGVNHIGQYLQPLLAPPRKILILSDPTVWPLFGSQVQASLSDAGYSVFHFIVPEGEAAKQLSIAETVYTFAFDNNFSRQDIFLALGGGVVGDLTGFCAATYFRGAHLAQVPTTLLAQVDSSVGGKVAVNFREAKNGIGVFYQPFIVLADTGMLGTLPPRQVKAGLAEVVKYALIETSCTGKNDFFEFLMRHAADLAQGWTPGNDFIWVELIYRCCDIKADVVAQDETERLGIRSFLNLGHTFAHAYEEMTGYTEFLHGEAVAFGLKHACDLAVLTGDFPANENRRFHALCQALDLPLFPSRAFPAEKMIALMRHDKKSDDSRTIKLVLPKNSIGQVCLTDRVSEDDIRKVLSAR